MNRTSWLQVDISAVKSMHLKLSLPNIAVSAPEEGSGALPTLPVGMWVEVGVESRDAMGRTFHSTNAPIHYRLNRFDLVDVKPSADNRTLKIHLKEAGETALRVWDAREPKLAGYLRLTAGDVLLPAGKRDFTVGEIACFTSPIVDERAATAVEWAIVGAGGVVESVGDATGMVVMRQQGEATVYGHLGEQQEASTHSKVSACKILGQLGLAVFLFIPHNITSH